MPNFEELLGYFQRQKSFNILNAISHQALEKIRQDGLAPDIMLSIIYNLHIHNCQITNEHIDRLLTIAQNDHLKDFDIILECLSKDELPSENSKLAITGDILNDILNRPSPSKALLAYHLLHQHSVAYYYKDYQDWIFSAENNDDHPAKIATYIAALHNYNLLTTPNIQHLKAQGVNSQSLANLQGLEDCNNDKLLKLKQSLNETFVEGFLKVSEVLKAYQTQTQDHAVFCQDIINQILKHNKAGLALQACEELYANGLMQYADKVLMSPHPFKFQSRLKTALIERGRLDNNLEGLDTNVTQSQIKMIIEKLHQYDELDLGEGPRKFASLIGRPRYFSISDHQLYCDAIEQPNLKSFQGFIDALNVTLKDHTDYQGYFYNKIALGEYREARQNIVCYLARHLHKSINYFAEEAFLNKVAECREPIAVSNASKIIVDKACNSANRLEDPIAYWLVEKEGEPAPSFLDNPPYYAHIINKLHATRNLTSNDIVAILSYREPERVLQALQTLEEYNLLETIYLDAEKTLFGYRNYIVELGDLIEQLHQAGLLYDGLITQLEQCGHDIFRLCELIWDIYNSYFKPDIESTAPSVLVKQFQQCINLIMIDPSQHSNQTNDRLNKLRQTGLLNNQLSQQTLTFLFKQAMHGEAMHGEAFEAVMYLCSQGYNTEADINKMLEYKTILAQFYKSNHSVLIEDAMLVSLSKKLNIDISNTTLELLSMSETHDEPSPISYLINLTDAGYQATVKQFLELISNHPRAERICHAIHSLFPARNGELVKHKNDDEFLKFLIENFQPNSFAADYFLDSFLYLIQMVGVSYIYNTTLQAVLNKTLDFISKCCSSSDINPDIFKTAMDFKSFEQCLAKITSDDPRLKVPASYLKTAQAFNNICLQFFDSIVASTAEQRECAIGSQAPADFEKSQEQLKHFLQSMPTNFLENPHLTEAIVSYANQLREFDWEGTSNNDDAITWSQLIQAVELHIQLTGVSISKNSEEHREGWPQDEQMNAQYFDNLVHQAWQLNALEDYIKKRITSDDNTQPQLANIQTFLQSDELQTIYFNSQLTPNQLLEIAHLDSNQFQTPYILNLLINYRLRMVEPSITTVQQLGHAIEHSQQQAQVFNPDIGQDIQSDADLRAWQLATDQDPISFQSFIGFAQNSEPTAVPITLEQITTMSDDDLLEKINNNIVMDQNSLTQPGDQPINRSLPFFTQQTYELFQYYNYTTHPISRKQLSIAPQITKDHVNLSFLRAMLKAGCSHDNPKSLPEPPSDPNILLLSYSLKSRQQLIAQAMQTFNDTFWNPLTFLFGDNKAYRVQQIEQFRQSSIHDILDHYINVIQLFYQHQGSNQVEKLKNNYLKPVQSDDLNQAVANINGHEPIPKCKQRMTCSRSLTLDNASTSQSTSNFTFYSDPGLNYRTTRADDNHQEDPESYTEMRRLL